MSRQKKKTPFPSWTTKTSNGIEKRYIRIGNSLMLSKVYQMLSNSAKVIYSYMLLESGSNREFEFTASIYLKLMSRDTFFKARNELIEKGFIEIKQNNANIRKANVYAFSEAWKEKDKEERG